jgi:hypothetical protein
MRSGHSSLPRSEWHGHVRPIRDENLPKVLVQNHFRATRPCVMKISPIVPVGGVRVVYAATLLVGLVVQCQTLDSRGGGCCRAAY